MLALSVTAKLFEKAIFNRVTAYLDENKLLLKYQSGFRPMHFTLTALTDTTDNWYLNSEDGLTNAILFIDFKKGFDAINHEILLSKLELDRFKGASLIFFSRLPLWQNSVPVINKANCEIVKLVSYVKYVVGCLKAQSSVPCYSCSTFMTFHQWLFVV